MSRDPLPLHAKFKVFPRGRWYHFSVFIWKRKGDMRRELRKAGVTEVSRCEAICCCNRLVEVPKRGKARMTGLLGQIHFYEKSFTMGIITHESGHAALGWAREAGVDVIDESNGRNVSDGEERFCWVLGNIARQIVLKTDRQWKYRGGRTTKGVSYV